MDQNWVEVVETIENEIQVNSLDPRLSNPDLRSGTVRWYRVIVTYSVRVYGVYIDKFTMLI